MRSPLHNSGFTLVEVVTTITITAILAAVVAVFITRPIQGYQDLGRRAALVDAAESSLRRMARDLRSALPNSVRVTNLGGGGFALELLPTLDGAKYNTKAGSADEKLSFKGDDKFDILGCFHNPAIALGVINPLRIVINNLGTAGSDVYADAGLAVGSESVITPASGMTITLSVNPGPGACGVSGNRHHIEFDPQHNFRGGVSTNQRLFVVTTPVTYLCNPATGTLTRYANYTIQASQPTTAAVLNGLPGITSSLVADHLSACGVTTSAADISNRAIAMLDLSLSDQGEQIRLIHQVRLDNSR